MTDKADKYSWFSLSTGFYDLPFEQLYWLNARSRKMAQDLHSDAFLYGVYGALDGISNSYSAWKYFFDMSYLHSDLDGGDMLHNWILSPEGMLIVGLQTLVMATGSAISNYGIKDKDKNTGIHYVAMAWPYLREVIKGLKNAFKGLRATLSTAGVLFNTSFSYLLFPGAIILGVLATVNRLLLRRMINIRKGYMSHNKKALEEVQNWMGIEPPSSYKKITPLTQDKTVQQLALVGAAFGGLVDGMYMFMGVLGMVMAGVGFPMFVFMASCSLVYLVSCIAARVYQEYNYQRLLDVSVTKVELAEHARTLRYEHHQLLGKIEAFTQYKQCNYIKAHTAEYKQACKDYQAIIDAKLNQCLAELKKFHQSHTQLIDQQRIGWGRAFLMGLNNGLSAYGALTSGMFALSTILFLCSMSLPVSVIIGCVTSGLVLLTAFLGYSLHQASVHQRNAKEMTEGVQRDVDYVRKAMVFSKNTVTGLGEEVVETKILPHATVDPSPQMWFQEWFEVIRSFFSGIGKGFKHVDFTMGAYQELGEDGHYHSQSGFLIVLGCVSAMISSVCLALRALMKGFGREPLEEENTLKVKEASADNDESRRSDIGDLKAPATVIARGSAEAVRTDQTNGFKKSGHALHHRGLFHTTPAKILALTGPQNTGCQL